MHRKTTRRLRSGLSASLCALPLLMLAMSCGSGDNDYRCTPGSTTQCVLPELNGICDVTGHCAFPDATCPSGQRYISYSQNGCVVPPDLARVFDLEPRYDFEPVFDFETPVDLAPSLDLSVIDAATPIDLAPPADFRIPDLCVGSSDDPQNCGGCGIVCATGQYCSAGRCACPAATPNFCATDMESFCTNVNADPDNCGRCGNACPPGQVCASGNCVENCAPTYTNCGNYCALTQTDANNCGACGNACASTNGTPQCVSGQCGYSACSTGYYWSDNACVACSTACASGSYQVAACGGSTDQTCAPCAAIANCASVTCTTMNASTCTACDPGYYLNGGACSPIVVTHQGWSVIEALGAKTPVAQATGLVAEPATVTLAWNALTVNSGSITSYNIYRATTPYAEDYTNPIATNIAIMTPTYVDATVTGGDTYYYTLAAVVGGVTYPTAVSAFSEVKVIVPPPNMALIHPWIANAEMCGLMQKTTDPNNDYRCDYTGVPTYFDTPAFFVDVNELGCNYTPAPACDATNGCLGTTAPGTGVGTVGNVFYNRGGGNCYVKTTATAWTDMNTTTLTAAQRTLGASSSPGLPPLVMISQTSGYASCTSLTATGFGAKSLLTHKQQVIAGAWSASLTDTMISTIQNGVSLPTTGNCNSNSANGLNYDNYITPGNLETLPGTSSSTILSVRTGSNSTRNCVSRYGVQDLTGNVWEWSSDQLSTCVASGYSCTGSANTLDPTNSDWSTYIFNNTNGIPTSSTYEALSGAGHFLVPLGLPVDAAAPSAWGATTIGMSSGQLNPAKLHNDQYYSPYYKYNSDGTLRGTHAGGHWTDSAYAGRFDVYLDDYATFTANYVGLRCAARAQ